MFIQKKTIILYNILIQAQKKKLFEDHCGKHRSMSHSRMLSGESRLVKNVEHRCINLLSVPLEIAQHVYERDTSYPHLFMKNRIEHQGSYASAPSKGRSHCDPEMMLAFMEVTDHNSDVQSKPGNMRPTDFCSFRDESVSVGLLWFRQ